MLELGSVGVSDGTVFYILTRQLEPQGNLICVTDKQSASERSLLFYKGSFDL